MTNAIKTENEDLYYAGYENSSSYRIPSLLKTSKGTLLAAIDKRITGAQDCGNIDKRYLDHCPKCGSKNVDYATRVIGYLKLVSNFSQVRQEEASHRAYTHKL